MGYLVKNFEVYMKLINIILVVSISMLVIGSGMGATSGSFEMRDNSYLKMQNSSLENIQSINGNSVYIYNPYAYVNSESGYYKVQLHCHSTESDGVDTPSAVVIAYKNAGYAAVSLTDHNVYTVDPGVAGITFIPGVEETPIGSTHVTSSGDPTANGNAYTPPYTNYCISDRLDWHMARGGLTTIAHPGGWGGNSPDSMIYLPKFNNMEIMSNTALYCISYWDEVLTAGRRVFGTATDDCHNVSGAAFNKGSVYVASPTTEETDLISAIKRGAFYASSGNTLNVSMSGLTITATTPTSSTIRFIGNAGRVLNSMVGSTSATYTIEGSEKYVRVEAWLTTDTSLRAWSQPIFLMTDSQEMDVVNENRRTRNWLDNGDFQIWENGTSFVNRVDNSYTSDRWYLDGSLANKSVTQEVLSDSMGENALEMTLNSFGTGDNCSILQGLDSKNVKQLRGKDVTFSFWAKRSSTFNSGNFTVNMYTGTTADQLRASAGRINNTFPHSYSELTTDGWTRISQRMTVMLSSNSLCVVVGMRKTTPAAPDGSTIWIRNAQLEVGSVPTKFEQISYEEQLRNCQYYQRVFRGGDYPIIAVAPSSSANSVMFYLTQTPMRSLVETKLIGTVNTDWMVLNGTTGGVISGLTGYTHYHTSKDTAAVQVNKAAGFTPGIMYKLSLSTSSGALILDANLW
jgi:hypothetical protein